MSHATNRPVCRVPEPLHVVAVVSNGRRFRSRYALARDFAARLACNPAVELTLVELALGDRPFELSDVPCQRYVPLRSGHELFHKENLVNVGVSRLPATAKYIAWVDADVDFARHDWAEEAVHQLQHHRVVQLFSKCLDLGPDYLPTRKYARTDKILWSGFGCRHALGLPMSATHGDYDAADFGHPGFGWAIRRDTFDAMGGLYDRSLLGAADHMMAWAFIGRFDQGIHGGINDRFKLHARRWGERAFAAVDGHVGYVDGLLLHHWHGPKSARRYVERWKVLIDGDFHPDTDLFPDWQGVLQIGPEKPDLIRDVQRYFQQRDEDSTTPDLLPL